MATRMRAIEDNIEAEVGRESPPLDYVIASLLDLDYDGLHNVLLDEAKRIVKMMEADGWYGKHGFPVTPRNVAALGFVQGVTFAVAAERARNAT